jgi:2-aminoadipate transaminase
MNAPTPRTALDTTPPFAARARNATNSVIREILKVAQQPDVVSLAGGLPAPESFPVDALRAAFDRVLRDEGANALQYSATEGHGPLREWIAAQETARGVPTTADEVLIVSGSQQALDLIGKAFAEPGRPLLVEAPTYLGALQAFALFEPTFRSVPTDEYGVLPAALDRKLLRDARLFYLMPNFQNPTGTTLSSARREELALAAARADLWLVEDDPYGELWYRTAPPPSLRHWLPERTIRISSLSKVLAPGLRLGYVIAPRALIDVLVRLKQATDLHTATLAQRAAHDVLASGLLDRHLPQVRRHYAQRCSAMLQALRAHMPEGTTWTQPQGGMFVWVTLPAGHDTSALLARAVERKVVYVPGAAFYASPGEKETQRNHLRLSFVTVSAERIAAGVATLADLIKHESRA